MFCSIMCYQNRKVNQWIQATRGDLQKILVSLKRTLQRFLSRRTNKKMRNKWFSLSQSRTTRERLRFWKLPSPSRELFSKNPSKLQKLQVLTKQSRSGMQTRRSIQIVVPTKIRSPRPSFNKNRSKLKILLMWTSSLTTQTAILSLTHLAITLGRRTRKSSLSYCSGSTARTFRKSRSS